MSDFTVFTEMLIRAGITFTKHPYTGSSRLPAVSVVRIMAGDQITGLPIEAHWHQTAVFGYMGFYTDMYFDQSGTLINLGAYE